MRGTILGGLFLLMSLGLPAAGGAPLVAQDTRDLTSEPRLLAEAQRREVTGDLAGSERVLLELLDQYPTSSGGLFAYERLLRRQGRVVEVLPAVDRFLGVEAGASGPRFLKLRVLIEVDSLAEARAAADAWLAVDPGSPEPYRQTAALFAEAFGPHDALAVLRQGAAAMDNSLLAIETADLLRQMGSREDALREWSRALGDEGSQLPEILERVGTMNARDRQALRPLVQELGREPTTLARQRAGAQIALEAGLEEDAIELARWAIVEMDESARRGFLVGLVRQSEALELDQTTLWIYQTLRERSSERGEALALDRQIVEMAAAVGDTALALSAQERMIADLPPASAERRDATANAIRLSVAVEDPAAVQRRLDDFRADFPGARDLDELAVGLAALWNERGDRTAGQRVLQEVDGPRSALQRAYLALEEDRPDLARVKQDLAVAAEGIHGSDATEVIQLLALLNRVGEDAARLAGRAAALAHRGRASSAVERLRDGVAALPLEDRPPLLALGARIAEVAAAAEGTARSGRGPAMEERRAEFLEAIVDDFAAAPEAPEAMLALARHRLRSGGPQEAAVQLLETLILTRPESPVVPDARRELQRLRQGGTGADGASR